MWRSLLFVAFVGCSVALVRAHSGHHEERPNPERQATTKSPAQISDHRFFLQEIFTKYGHNGQMTFEGFEHLLESLGLGNIIITDHDVSAHKEDSFQTSHDTHDHSKKDTALHLDHHDDHKHPPDDHKAAKLATDGKLLASLKQSMPSSMAPLQNRLKSSEINAIPEGNGPSKVRPSSTTPTSTTSQNQAASGGSTLTADQMYHYNLPGSQIPELLVNISSIVDQHQELVNEPQEIVIEQCLSPKEILETFGINQNSSLNPVSFLHLCPAIIYELDQGHCMFRDLPYGKNKNITTFQQWLYALLAVLAISLCGLLSVAVIPIMQKWFYQTLLQFLVGLAVGSLSGDGLLHLMPHAMLTGDGGHGRSSLLMDVAEKTAVWRGFTALGGILFFFVAERLLAVITSRKKTHRKGSEGGSEIPESMFYSEDRVGQKLSQYRKDSNLELSQKEMMQTVLKRVPSQDAIKHAHGGHGHGHGHSHEMPESISAVAYMVIMGDGLHNFCDGLAIGAAFASGIEGGISTAVAVFCHELPHELGDFAMLLRTGMGARRALLYNILSSGLCLAGTAIGLCLGGVSSATGWVFALTAGIFLYVALVDMLPELSSSSNPDANPLHQLAIQVLGISTGVSIMLIIANYEQELQSIVS